MGQLCALATAAIRRSLSSFSIAHSSSMCSAVGLSFPYGQFGASMNYDQDHRLDHNNRFSRYLSMVKLPTRIRCNQYTV